jgi:hypothetical protein
MKFVELDEASIRVLLFPEASHVKNKDLSSQIGYVIVLIHKFGNIIYHHRPLVIDQVPESDPKDPGFRTVCSRTRFGYGGGMEVNSRPATRHQGTINIM